MAILDQGLIGTFKGKMGSLVIAKWKNKYVGKSKPKSSSKARTELQLDQQSKFRLVGKFMSGFSSTISFSYQKLTVGTTAMNEAMRYNLNNSISGVYPNYSLNFANIQLSDPMEKREIDGGISPVITASPQRKIKLTWKIDDPQNYEKTKDTDQVYAFLYHPEKKISFASTHPQRSKLTLDFSVPGIFLGEVHAWLFFVSADRKLVSKTEYLGKVTVVA